jgi:hypothetical protein
MVSRKPPSEARTARTKGPTGSSALHTQAGELILQLRHVQSAVVVAVAALRQQNCELDQDVASLLRSVSDRIADQIDRLQIAMGTQITARAARSRSTARSAALAARQ